GKELCGNCAGAGFLADTNPEATPMARILILMTKARTLGLLDGRQHPSGFWAEEFVVPYERFVAAGYDVDVATIGGVPPTPDAGSLSKRTVGATRPEGSPDHDLADIAH